MRAVSGCRRMVHRNPPSSRGFAMEVAALIAAGLTVLTVALYGVFSDE
jgi:hypothetical protein